MGGEIKVVKKNGPGTLMRLFLLLSTPADGTEQHGQVDFAKQSVAVSKVLLFGAAKSFALYFCWSTSRLIFILHKPRRKTS